jgi:uncharacterized protein YjlB
LRFIYGILSHTHQENNMPGSKEIQSISLTDDGIFPNNAQVPLRVYPNFFGPAPAPESIESLVRNNGWPPAWRYTVYTYHHYHSRAHEFLGCFAGRASILFGGDRGKILEIQSGDGVMIPAGVSHKRLSPGPFTAVGAYPVGQSPDMNLGDPRERPGADHNILSLGLPATDPVTGDPYTL